jgi:DUF1365 family protein
VYFCYRKDDRRLWIVVLEVRIQHMSQMFEGSPYGTTDSQYLWRTPRPYP